MAINTRENFMGMRDVSAFLDAFSHLPQGWQLRRSRSRRLPGILAPRAGHLSVEFLEQRSLLSAATTTFTLQGSWTNGFQAEMTIRNTDTTAINGWQVSFDAPFSITSIWNSRIVTQSALNPAAAAAVSRLLVADSGYNALIAPGATVSFGFIGSATGTVGQPTNVSVIAGMAPAPTPTATPTPTRSSILLDGVDLSGPLTQVTVKQGITEFRLVNAAPGLRVTASNGSVVTASVKDGVVRIEGLAAGRTGLRLEDPASGAVRYLGVRVRTAAGALPGMPDTLAIGSVSEDSASDLAFWNDIDTDRTNKRIDTRYIYLNGGPENGWRTWGNGDGGRVISYLQESQKLGIVPAFVWYNISDGGESYWTNGQHIASQTYLESYFKDLKFALDLIQKYAPDDPVKMILEPDFIGYIMQMSGQQPGQIAAMTRAAYSSGVLKQGVDPAFTDTLPGLVKAINYTISKYAPNIEFGWQFNLWASPGVTVGIPVTGLMRLTDTLGIAAGRDAISREAGLIADYYINAGILSYGADFVSIDKYGLDAGFQTDAAANPAASTWFWNADHWNNYLLFTKVLHQKTALPVTLWQLPVGHINGSLTTNPYAPSGVFPDLTNTFTKYEDSAPTFFFGDSFTAGGKRLDYFATNRGGDAKVSVQAGVVTWGSHLAEARAAGVTAILFGAGVGESTDGVGSPPTDGSWWITKVQDYYSTSLVRFVSHDIFWGAADLTNQRRFRVVQRARSSLESHYDLVTSFRHSNATSQSRLTRFNGIAGAGMSTTTSPKGRRITPRLRAASVTSCPSRNLASNGTIPSRSRTNSIPIISPF